MAGKKLIIIITLLFSSIFLVGCFDGIRIPLGEGNSIQIKSGDEGVSFNIQGEDGSMDFSADDGKFSMETEDGKVTVYREIPDHFPKEIPIPSDITPVGNFVTEAEMEDGSHVFALAFQVGVDREEEIKKLYENFVNSNNYEIMNETDVAGIVPIVAENEDTIFTYGVMKDDENMILTVHYTIKGDGE